jgi:hypothetical protein
MRQLRCHDVVLIGREAESRPPGRGSRRGCIRPGRARPRRGGGRRRQDGARARCARRLRVDGPAGVAIQGGGPAYWPLLAALRVQARAAGRSLRPSSNRCCQAIAEPLHPSAPRSGGSRLDALDHRRRAWRCPVPRRSPVGRRGDHAHRRHAPGATSAPSSAAARAPTPAAGRPSWACSSRPRSRYGIGRGHIRQSGHWSELRPLLPCHQATATTNGTHDAGQWQGGCQPRDRARGPRTGHGRVPDRRRGSHGRQAGDHFPDEGGGARGARRRRIWRR